MLRSKLCKEISKRTEYPYEVVNEIVKEFEYMIIELISENDSVKLYFGEIGGYTKEPQRINGFYRTFRQIRSRDGWSLAKQGRPYISWRNIVRQNLYIPAEEYFAETENRYTSLARRYREDLGLPEIPEYEGLSEEKIQQLCRKADIRKYGEDVILNKERASNWESSKKRKMWDLRIRQEEDLERQREMGVPEDELVLHTAKEIEDINVSDALLRQDVLKGLPTLKQYGYDKYFDIDDVM